MANGNCCINNRVIRGMVLGGSSAPAPPVPPLNEPYTQAFLDASGISDSTIIDALNEMEIALTTDGFIDFSNPSANLLKTLYPVVGGTASTHKWNFLDPQDTDAAFRLTFNGGIVHSATGAQFNGIDGYADTHFRNLDMTSAQAGTMGYYSRTNSAAGNLIGGTFDATTYHLIQMTGSFALMGDFPSGVIFFAAGDTRGFWTVTRRSNVDTECYKNTTSMGVGAGPNSSPVNGGGGAFTSFIGARSDAGVPSNFSAHECSFAFHGTTGMTAGQIANLYNNIVLPFQTALGRNV